MPNALAGKWLFQWSLKWLAWIVLTNASISSMTSYYIVVALTTLGCHPWIHSNRYQWQLAWAYHVLYSGQWTCLKVDLLFSQMLVLAIWWMLIQLSLIPSHPSIERIACNHYYKSRSIDFWRGSNFFGDPSIEFKSYKSSLKEEACILCNHELSLNAFEYGIMSLNYAFGGLEKAWQTLITGYFIG